MKFAKTAKYPCSSTSSKASKERNANDAEEGEEVWAPTSEVSTSSVVVVDSKEVVYVMARFQMGANGLFGGTYPVPRRYYERILRFCKRWRGRSISIIV